MLLQQVVDRFLHSEQSREYNLDTHEVTLLLCLANRCGIKEDCYPSQDYIMNYCRMSQSKLFRSIKSLISKNIMQVRKNGRNYIYTLTVPLVIYKSPIDKTDSSLTDYYETQIVVPQTTIHPEYQSVGLPNISTKANISVRANIKTKAKRKKRVSCTESVTLPTWINKEQWDEFLQHRKSMKSPMTELAQNKAIKLLEKLKEEGQNVDQIINNSIINGWKGLFAEKLTKGNEHGKVNELHGESRGKSKTSWHEESLRVLTAWSNGEELPCDETNDGATGNLWY